MTDTVPLTLSAMVSTSSEVDAASTPQSPSEGPATPSTASASLTGMEAFNLEDVAAGLDSDVNGTANVLEVRRVKESMAVAAAKQALEAPPTPPAETPASESATAPPEAAGRPADAVGATTRRGVCDACPDCDDVCGMSMCKPCKMKRERIVLRDEARGRRACGYMLRVTMCQVSRHNTRDDLWLAAHGKVYDVTNFVDKHPGGVRSLTRHAGQECSRDFDFHSAGAQKDWKRYRIGTVVRCKSEGGRNCVIS